MYKHTAGGGPGRVGKSGDQTNQWKGDAAGYLAAHVRLYAARGKAAEHVCSCGAPAAEWAYDHQDIDEKIGAGRFDGRPFSLKPDHYDALCKRCHSLRDKHRARL